MTITELKKEVLRVCKELPKCGLVTGTAGNVSARDPETNLVAIKPSGVPYETMEIDDIVVLNLDGSVVEKKSNRKSSFETPTHLDIYRIYPHINGVIHTHSKYVNILSSVKREIPCATTPTGRRLLLAPIPVIDFINNGTQEMADKVTPPLKDNVAVAIQNHGPFIIGETLQLALERSIALEDTSQIYYMASLLGKPSLITD